jgi:hypothetical protein
MITSCNDIPLPHLILRVTSKSGELTYYYASLPQSLDSVCIRLILGSSANAALYLTSMIGEGYYVRSSRV